MYRALVRRRTEANFARLTEGDHASIIAQLADDVRHVFTGGGPLGGQRNSRDAVERWFERLYRLFPALRFEVQSCTSSGPPWNIWVAVEWIAHVTPAAGDPYVNEGAHIIQIRRGKVAYFHAYEDSQKVARACEQMTALGVEEASAPPITD